MVILVILITVAIPSFRQLIVGQRIKNGAFDLFAALEYGRSEAIKRPTSTILVCAGDSTANNGTWSTGWRVVVSPCTSGALRSWVSAARLTVTEKVGAGATPVTFSKDGRITSTAPKLELAPAPAVAGVTARCVQIDLSGRPKTQTGACP